MRQIWYIEFLLPVRIDFFLNISIVRIFSVLYFVCECTHFKRCMDGTQMYGYGEYDQGMSSRRQSCAQFHVHERIFTNHHHINITTTLLITTTPFFYYYIYFFIIIIIFLIYCYIIIFIILLYLFTLAYYYFYYLILIF